MHNQRRYSLPKSKQVPTNHTATHIGVQELFDAPHPVHRRPRLGVVDVLRLLEAQPVLCRYATSVPSWSRASGVVLLPSTLLATCSSGRSVCYTCIPVQSKTNGSRRPSSSVEWPSPTTFRCRLPSKQTTDHSHTMNTNTPLHSPSPMCPYPTVHSVTSAHLSLTSSTRSYRTLSGSEMSYCKTQTSEREESAVL